MITHVVCWNFKEELSKEKRVQAGNRIKSELTELEGQINGLIKIEVQTDLLESSNREIALICNFESVESLNHYQMHPKHLEATDFIKSVTCDRVCIDY